MGQMKTPGVYIVEKSAFPNSVVEVATAVPAFIGHTQKADNKGTSLANKPWRITSMAEFENYFGFGPTPEFNLSTTAPEGGGEALTFAGKAYYLTQDSTPYILYYSLRLFFQNGGGPCYIVSVGNYGDALEAARFTKGIELLITEQEPTMVVVPEAVRLAFADCNSVQQVALQHCGLTMKNRVAILDIHDGYKSRQDPAGDPVALFRDKLGINFLNYAAAYYPWLNTTITSERALSYENLSAESRTTLISLVEEELGLTGTLDKRHEEQKTEVEKITKDWSADDKVTPADIPSLKALLNQSLMAMSPAYNRILNQMAATLNLLPPSAAMAGIYTMVDNTRGVWKAPANVSLSGVVSPTLNLSNQDQEDLNVTPMGKSINAIRPFVGEGVLVWGARTLDGNSLDWRYINVRRTMIMLEESIRLATKAYVFEPNVANTWVTIKSMIRNFLTGIWKRGGLAGAVPDDAFAVFVGLGETMTPEDILEGILRVTVLVAITRPAEFIEITFQQQMQKS
ncbi:MAG: phage tail protein [Rhodocyclaceae bacterium]|nr:phage tail protein [Rhodocyclaceae bacterium]